MRLCDITLCGPVGLYDGDELLDAVSAAGADQAGVFHVQPVDTAALEGCRQGSRHPREVAVAVLREQVHLVADHDQRPRPT